MGKRNKGIGNAAGSILAYQLMNRPAENKVTTRPKTEQELRQEEFDAIKREHNEQFVTVEVPATAWETAQTGRATKQVEVNRREHEDKNGITGLRQIWTKEPAEIQALAGDFTNPVNKARMIDPSARFPTTSTPVELTDEDATKIVEKAQAFLSSKHLSEADRNRVALFASVHVESNSLINAADPALFQIAYDRLVELGCITAQAKTPTGEPEPSADQLATEADSNYRDVALPLLSSWRSSLRANWGIELNDRLRDIAVDIMERHNLNPTLYESYDFVRIQMANRKLIRTDKTADGRPLTRSEFVADAIDRNNIDLSRPENKRWFMEQQDLILNGGE